MKTLLILCCFIVVFGGNGGFVAKAFERPKQNVKVHRIGMHHEVLDHHASHHTAHRRHRGTHGLSKNNLHRQRKSTSKHRVAHRRKLHPKTIVHPAKTAAMANAALAPGSERLLKKDSSSAKASTASIVSSNGGAPATSLEHELGTSTGLPLPRFAALRADKVYFRKGPGQRYAIDWVYHRRGLPVKIEREFDVWRLVEDSDGYKGWVHQATLVGQRTFVVPMPLSLRALQDPPPREKSTTEPKKHTDSRIISFIKDGQGVRPPEGSVTVYSEPNTQGRVVARLLPGSVGKLLVCELNSPWCKIAIKAYKGWLMRDRIWGLLPSEVLQPS